MNKTLNDFKKALATDFRRKYAVELDKKGYVKSPEDNLLRGVCMKQFEENLHEGDGDELRMKFCAIHSSSALAVNCFAPFTQRPERLSILQESGASVVRFEEKFPIFKRGHAPNLDVWIE